MTINLHTEIDGKGFKGVVRVPTVPDKDISFALAGSVLLIQIKGMKPTGVDVVGHQVSTDGSKITLIDPSKIWAELKNGVITITAPWKKTSVKVKNVLFASK